MRRLLTFLVLAALLTLTVAAIGCGDKGAVKPPLPQAMPAKLRQLPPPANSITKAPRTVFH